MTDTTETPPEPIKATRIVQAALRAFCETDLEEFEATIDGMLIRVTRDDWIVCEAKGGN